MREDSSFGYIYTLVDNSRVAIRVLYKVRIDGKDLSPGSVAEHIGRKLWTVR